MEWISGIQAALSLIEDQLDSEISYPELARVAHCSEYNLMRVFSVLSGRTLADYIRCRRLTVAAQELMRGAQVIDTALKFGWDSPESFTRAFVRFHGITPRQARSGGALLRSVSPLVLTINIQGGFDMKYRIETRSAQTFLGFGKRFTGVPSDRGSQEEHFFTRSRLGQYALMGLSGDCETQHTLVLNADEEGYEFCIAAPFSDQLPPARWEAIARLNPDLAGMLREIHVPAATYAVFETDPGRYPTLDQAALRRKVFAEWLPSSGYQLTGGAEISVIHWYMAPKRDQRFIELWLPVSQI